MPNEKLLAAQKQVKIDQGALQFFQKHPELNPCEANVSILSSEIMLKNLPLDVIKSWEKAFETVSGMLAPRMTETPAPESEPEKWPYAFPEIHTPADVKNLDGKIFKDFWNDKDKSGKPSKKSLEFRAVVQAILDKVNAARGKR
jgi:hypothetical protein